MCDRIIMPDGSEIESIRGEGECLCGETQTATLTWIVQRLPPLEFDDRLIIERAPFGWIVQTTKNVME